MSKMPGRRALLAVAAALAVPHIARAAVRTVRLGHSGPERSHYGVGAAAFAAAVAGCPALEGLQITVHAESELGDEATMLKHITKGLLDLACISGSMMGAVVPEMAVFSAPFLFASPEAARRTLDGPVGQAMTGRAAGRDVHVLAWGENGLRHITADRAIRTPADLKGLRLRVPRSDVILAGMRALGAEVGTLAFAQLREALRSGQFQGQENPIGVIEASKLFELQTHLSLTGHIYDPALVLSSPDLIEDLRPAQREALTDCARAGGAAMREASAAAERDGVARLGSMGMTVTQDVDRASFVSAIKPWLGSLELTFGKGRIDALTHAGMA